MYANAFLLSSVTPRMFAYDMKVNDHADYLEEVSQIIAGMNKTKTSQVGAPFED